MDYIAGMSSSQGLAQRYSEDLATRASELQGSANTALELGSQYQQQMTNYKNMIDKPYETFGEVAGEYLATKAFAFAKSKYLETKSAFTQKTNVDEIANNNDVAPPSAQSSASTSASTENIAPEPDINAGETGTELTEMTSIPIREGASADLDLGVSSSADSGARGILSADDVNTLTYPVIPDAPVLADTPSVVGETSSIIKTGESAGEKVGADVAEDTVLDATGIGEVLMGVQLVSGVGSFLKDLFDPSKPKPPPPQLLPSTQQANFIQSSVQQGT